MSQWPDQRSPWPPFCPSQRCRATSGRCGLPWIAPPVRNAESPPRMSPSIARPHACARRSPRPWPARAAAPGRMPRVGRIPPPRPPRRPPRRRPARWRSARSRRRGGSAAGRATWRRGTGACPHPAGPRSRCGMLGAWPNPVAPVARAPVAVGGVAPCAPRRPPPTSTVPSSSSTSSASPTAASSWRTTRGGSCSCRTRSRASACRRASPIGGTTGSGGPRRSPCFAPRRIGRSTCGRRPPSNGHRGTAPAVPSSATSGWSGSGR